MGDAQSLAGTGSSTPEDTSLSSSFSTSVFSAKGRNYGGDNVVVQLLLSNVALPCD